MNKKLFLIASSLFVVSLYAGSNTCYSVQFQSSYSPLSVENFPADSKVIKIGKAYTARYGCFNKFKNAKKKLSDFKSRYSHAMITSTYKWRFDNKVNNQKNKHIVKYPLANEQKNKRTVKYPQFVEQKPTIYTESNKQNNTKNIQKCYSVQLSLSKENLFGEEFPVGTKIINRGDYVSASYGCYTTIKDAKVTLDEMHKNRPQAIIIALSKSKYNASPEIQKRGDSLKDESHFLNSDTDYNVDIRDNILKNKERPNFYKINKNNITAKKKESDRCFNPIEKKLRPCRAKATFNTNELSWENVDRFAVEKYVNHKLNNEANLQAIKPYSKRVLINSRPNQPNEIKSIFASGGNLHSYVTASANVKNGQLDATGKLQKTRYLNLSPGITYLYNFNPSWYFYTDDRLIYRIKTSSRDLKLDVKELYVKSKNFFDNNANILIGRKYLKDERGWYYKTSLDTIGISNKNDLLLYELYLGKRLTKNNGSFDPNEVTTNLKDVKFLFAHLSYEFFKDNRVEGFFIHEDNENAAKKLHWIGLRSQGKVFQKNFNTLSYWGDLATMRGDLNNSSVKGLGFDIGAKYYFTNYFAAIAGSIAYGSGGKNLFVQPSFTNNRSNYLSKDLSFRQYGEFLQPELSNIKIGSLYFLRYLNTLKDKTLIVALHNYTQDKSSATQYSITNKTVNPNGNKGNIGNEIDLILHYDLFSGSYWRFSGSYFMGGDAFNGQTDKKDGFGAEIYFKYLW